MPTFSEITLTFLGGIVATLVGWVMLRSCYARNDAKGGGAAITILIGGLYALWCALTGHRFC